MKQSNQNFPFPVLAKGSLDYQKDCKFSLVINQFPKEVAGFIFFALEYELTSDGLRRLIKEENASVLIQVVCRETSFRKVYLFQGQQVLPISINKKELSGLISINSFVVANRNVENFLLPEHNKEFFTLPSQINKGDKLAIGETISFKLNKFDSLRPIASIVSIKENKETKEDVDLDLSGEKIVIFLSKELFEEYKKLREFPELRNYLAINVVMPSLVEALSEMRNNADTIDMDKRWVMTLDKVLKQLEVDLYSSDLSCYAIANLIFRNGLKTSLESLYNYFFTDKES